MIFWKGSKREGVYVPEECLARLKPLMEGKTISKVETAMTPDDEDVVMVLHLSDGSSMKICTFAAGGLGRLEIESSPALLESVLSATEGSGR